MSTPLTRKVEKALAAAQRANSPKAMRERAWRFSGPLQQEIWRGPYGFSWGTREEWTALLIEHPELLDMSTKRAVDTIFAHLREWSPELAAKETRARRAGSAGGSGAPLPLP